MHKFSAFYALNSHIRNCSSAEFDMKYLGDAKRILGMDIFSDRKRCVFFLNQTAYMEKNCW